MTLDEAIEKLKDALKRYEGYELPMDKAVKLGIEALEREQLLRREVPYNRDGLLPSETEEAK